jgi:hypothetical protein
MTEAHSPSTPGWTRLRTPQGPCEYQFQGSGPAVRGGRYLDARDYLFLVMDADGWLYRIPVCVADEAAAVLGKDRAAEEAKQAVRRAAEAQLRAGLAEFTPREGAPYEELDRYFSVDAARARQLAGG